MIIATFEQTEVEIVDVFRSGNIMIAIVRTMDGSKPFVGGSKQPVKTDWANIPIDRLNNIAQIEAPQPELDEDEEF